MRRNRVNSTNEGREEEGKRRGIRGKGGRNY